MNASERYVPKCPPLRWTKSYDGYEALSIHGNKVYAIEGSRAPHPYSLWIGTQAAMRNGRASHGGDFYSLQDAKDAAQKREDKTPYRVRENPANIAAEVGDMSTATKIGIAALGLVAVAGIGYAVMGGAKTAAASTAKALPPAGGTTTPAGTTWKAATTVQPGQTFRASADVLDTLTAMFPGATFITDHDAIPADWPAADLAAGETIGQTSKRFRIDAVWHGTTPLTVPTAAAVSAKINAMTTDPAQQQALLAAWNDLRIFIDATSGAVAKLLSSPTPQWTLAKPGDTIAAGTAFRASADVRVDLKALGLTIWDEFDTPPTDWPTTDNGPNRWRVQGVWVGAPVTVVSNLANGNALLWVQS
jgi:hypothetical protein